MNTALSVLPLLGRASDRLLALFYPEICQVCRDQRATFADCYLCATCRRGKDGIKPVEAPYCNCCGLPFPGDITVEFECANCREQQIHFRSARAAVEFSGVIKEVIHRYKYNHAAWFEPLLGQLLVDAASPSVCAADWDWIVPIPLPSEK